MPLPRARATGKKNESGRRGTAPATALPASFEDRLLLALDLLFFLGDFLIQFLDQRVYPRIDLE